ncbi:MAG: glycosyltransferase family 2 protein [Planctomycetota bacterium]
MSSDLSAPGPKRVLAIVPAYNEAGSIAAVCRDLAEHLPHVDVLVVDDGSTDGTHRHVPSAAKCVRLPFNLGIGIAVQTGYRYAFEHGYDMAMQIDADGQHPPEHAAALIDTLAESRADLVIGSRFLDDTPGNYRPPAGRMMGIVILRRVIRWLGGAAVTDCTSGFRVAGRRAIRCFAHWYPDDYPEPEVVLLLSRNCMAVVEAPIVMTDREHGETSIPFRRGVFYVLKVSFALALDTFRKPWPDPLLKPDPPSPASPADPAASETTP